MRSAPVHVGQIWRYLKIGLVNTAFGYALYAVLVALGLQMFAAQILATIIAVAFNYVSYSRYVFDSRRPARLRFLLSYGCNYLVGFLALKASAGLVSSPYAAGLLATLAAAIVNFVVLRRYVFTALPAASGVSRARLAASQLPAEGMPRASCH